MKKLIVKTVEKGQGITQMAARIRELESRVKFWQAIFFEKNLSEFKKA